MSRVDPVPTYDQVGRHSLFSALGRFSTEPQALAELLGLSGSVADARFITYCNRQLMHEDLFSYLDSGDRLDLDRLAHASKPLEGAGIPYRAKVAGDEMISHLFKSTKRVMDGAEAVVWAANHIIYSGRVPYQDSHGWCEWADQSARNCIRFQSSLIKQTISTMDQLCDQLTYSQLCKQADWTAHLVRRAFSTPLSAKDLVRSKGLRRSWHNVVDDLQELGGKAFFESSNERVKTLLAGCDVFAIGFNLVVVRDAKVAILGRKDCHKLVTLVESHARCISYGQVFRAGNRSTRTCTQISEALHESIQKMWAHQLGYKEQGKPMNAPIRAIHIWHTAFFQGIPESSASFKEVSSAREQAITKEALALCPEVTSILAPIISLRVRPLDKFDLFKIHQVSVSDDISILRLLREIDENRGITNPVDERSFNEFHSFCDMMDVRDFVKSYGRMPALGGEVTEDDLQWCQELMGQGAKIAPIARWGKIWIEGEYRYLKTAEDWHLRAKDATSVSPDGTISNELVDALTQGDTLGYGQNPAWWRDHVAEEGHVSYHYLAGKAETAKTQEKHRVTSSADAVFRQFQSEAEANQRRCNRCVKGVALGQGPVAQGRALQEVNSKAASLQYHVVSSHDISDWSRKQDRRHILKNISRTARACGVKDTRLWDNLWGKGAMMFLVDRCGVRRVGPFDEGSMQGYPGHSDSLHQLRIQQFALHRMAAKGLATGKGLERAVIDDALQDVEIRGDARTYIHKWDQCWEILVQTYKDLGYEVDQVKSIVGIRRYCFLNEHVWEGVILPSSTKTAVKMSAPVGDSIPILKEDEYSIMLAGAKAMFSGGEPVACAYLGYKYALLHRSRFVGEPLDYQKTAAMMVLPSPGWEYPLLTSLVTEGSGSTYQDRVHLLVECERHLSSTPFWETVGAWLELPDRYSTILSVSGGSEVMSKEGPPDPAVTRRSMLRQALCKTDLAEPYKTLANEELMDSAKLQMESVIRQSSASLAWFQAFYGTTGLAAVDDLVDKIGASQCLNQIVGAKVVNGIRRICRSQDFEQTRYLVNKKGNASAARAYYATSSSAKLVSHERTAAFNALGWDVQQHTYCHPADLIRVDPNPDPNTILFGYSQAALIRNPLSDNGNAMACTKGIECGDNAASYFEAVDQASYGNHPYARKIAVGVALVDDVDTSRSSCLIDALMESWGLNRDDAGPGVLNKKVAASVKRIPGNYQDRTYLPRFCRSNFKCAWANKDSIFKYLGSTLINIRTITWYLRHIACLASYYASSGQMTDITWGVTYNLMAFMQDEGQSSFVFPPRRSEAVVVLPVEQIIGVDEVRVCLSDWGRKAEALAAELGEQPQVADDPGDFAGRVEMQVDSGGDLRVKGPLDSVLDKGPIVYPAVRNLVATIVQEVAQDPRSGILGVAEEVLSEEEQFPFERVRSAYACSGFWVRVLGAVRALVHGQDVTVSQAMRHGLARCGLTNTVDVNVEDPTHIARVVGSNHRCLTIMAQLGLYGSAGSSIGHYRPSDGYVVVTHRHEAVNLARRKEAIRRICATDVVRLKKRVPTTSFVQGALDSRDGTVWTDDFHVDFPKTAANAKKRREEHLARALVRKHRDTSQPGTSGESMVEAEQEPKVESAAELEALLRAWLGEAEGLHPGLMNEEYIAGYMSRIRYLIIDLASHRDAVYAVAMVHRTKREVPKAVEKAMDVPPVASASSFNPSAARAALRELCGDVQDVEHNLTLVVSEAYRSTLKAISDRIDVPVVDITHEVLEVHLDAIKDLLEADTQYMSALDAGRDEGWGF